MPADGFHVAGISPKRLSPADRGSDLYQNANFLTAGMLPMLEYDQKPLPKRGRLAGPDGKSVALISAFNLAAWGLAKDTDQPYLDGAGWGMREEIADWFMPRHEQHVPEQPDLRR